MVGIIKPLQYRRLLVRVTVAVMSRKLDMGPPGSQWRGAFCQKAHYSLINYQFKTATVKNKILSYSLKGIGIVLILFIIISISYRFFIYPDNVRKDCAYEALNYVSEKQSYDVIEADLDYEFMYRFCLNKNGLRSTE